MAAAAEKAKEVVASACKPQQPGKGRANNKNRKLAPCSMEIWEALDRAVDMLAAKIHTPALGAKIFQWAQELKESLEKELNDMQDTAAVAEGKMPKKKRIELNLPCYAAAKRRVKLARQLGTSLAAASLPNGRSCFSAEEEKQIGHYLAFAADWDRMSNKKARRLIHALARVLFDREVKVSRKFLTGFMRRNSLEYYAVNELEMERYNKRVDVAMEILELARTIAAIKEHNGMTSPGERLPPQYVANLDEKPLFRSLGARVEKAIGAKQQRAAGVHKPAREMPKSELTRKSVTCELIVTANNDILPPGYFFTGGEASSHPVLEKKAEAVRKELPADQTFHFAFTPNGCIDTPSWRRYVVESLIPAIQEHRRRYNIPDHHQILLTMDGAGTIHTTNPPVLQAFKDANIVVFKHLAGSSTMRQANDNGPNAHIERNFKELIGDFEAEEDYHQVKLPKLIARILSLVKGQAPEFGSKAFRKAGTYDANNDKSNMWFLTDRDMLVAANGDTEEEAKAELLRLHAALPEYNLNFLQTQAPTKFLDYYDLDRRGPLKTLPPGPLQTLLTVFYKKHEQMSTQLLKQRTRAASSKGAWRSAAAQVTGDTYIEKVRHAHCEKLQLTVRGYQVTAWRAELNKDFKAKVALEEKKRDVVFDQAGVRAWATSVELKVPSDAPLSKSNLTSIIKLICEKKGLTYKTTMIALKKKHGVTQSNPRQDQLWSCLDDLFRSQFPELRNGSLTRHAPPTVDESGGPDEPDALAHAQGVLAAARVLMEAEEDDKETAPLDGANRDSEDSAADVEDESADTEEGEDDESS
jgi:hypothetical protein